MCLRLWVHTLGVITKLRLCMCGFRFGVGELVPVASDTDLPSPTEAQLPCMSIGVGVVPVNRRSARPGISDTEDGYLQCRQC